MATKIVKKECSSTSPEQHKWHFFLVVVIVKTMRYFMSVRVNKREYLLRRVFKPYFFSALGKKVMSYMMATDVGLCFNFAGLKCEGFPCSSCVCVFSLKTKRLKSIDFLVLSYESIILVSFVQHEKKNDEESHVALVWFCSCSFWRL